MTYQTYVEIPQDVLQAMVALLARKCGPIEAAPVSPDRLAEWNFNAGRRALVEELIDEIDRRAKESAAKGSKRG